MFEYYATVLKIVDGDTIDVMIDLGLGVHCKERLRFARINAWEMRGEHKEKGKQNDVHYTGLAIEIPEG